MSTHIVIDPVTRLEGHGKIDVILDGAGEVDHAYLQVPELRGFEKFVEGRPAEDLPQITSRICGVCPMAHHMASTKALDDLYRVEPTPAARAIRELVYDLFVFEDHALHFFFLGGPDFVVGPDAPRAVRNIAGVLDKVGVEVGKRVIAMRREARELISTIAGKVIHPVFGLPGGVSRAVSSEEQQRAIRVCGDAVEFAEFTLGLFRKVVLGNPGYVDAILSPAYTHRTYSMGLVDERGRLNFYDGELRVVTPEGKEHLRFAVQDYLHHVAEHVEPWSYMKFSYLKGVGWKGFVDGPESGVFAVGPLARLNAAESLPTPRAQAACDELFETLGGKPVHHTLAYHWARLVELLCAAESALERARSPELVDPDIRELPTEDPSVGVGVVEAPRGTLIHHYETDPRGIVTRANLVVATQHNAARIALSVDRAAKALIHGGRADDGVLNRVEMAFRAYDPCFGCATHALPGRMPLTLRVLDARGCPLREISRG